MNDDKVGSIYVATNDDVIEKWMEFVKEFDKSRFFISATNTLITEYINTILQGSAITINEESLFYRARINNEHPNKEFQKDELSAPPSNKANYGRLNSKGIPYLYISNEEVTAVKEVRPFIGAKIGLADCKPKRGLKILDLTKADEVEKLHNFRKMLSGLFSQPVSSFNAEKDYLPTQYLSEYIKNNGYDGVKYRSAVHSEGFNICLFDIEAVTITYLKQVEVKQVDVKYEC